MRRDKTIVRILLIFSVSNIALAAHAVVRQRPMDVAKAAAGKRGNSDDEAKDGSGSERSAPMPELASDSDESPHVANSGSEPYFTPPESPSNLESSHPGSPPTRPPPASFGEGSEPSRYPPSGWYSFDEYSSNHGPILQGFVPESESSSPYSYWLFGEDSTTHHYITPTSPSGSLHQDPTPESSDGSSHQDPTPESPDGSSHQDHTPESPDGSSHQDHTPELPNGSLHQDAAPVLPDDSSHQDPTPELPDGSSHPDTAPGLPDGSSHQDAAPVLPDDSSHQFVTPESPDGSSHLESSIGTPGMPEEWPSPSLHSMGGGSVAAQQDEKSESPLFNSLHVDSAPPESTFFNDAMKKKLKIGAAIGITVGLITIIYEVQKGGGNHSSGS